MLTRKHRIEGQIRTVGLNSKPKLNIMLKDSMEDIFDRLFLGKTVN